MEFLYPGALVAMIFVCVWYVVDRRSELNKLEQRRAAFAEYVRQPSAEMTPDQRDHVNSMLANTPVPEMTPERNEYIVKKMREAFWAHPGLADRMTAMGLNKQGGE